MIVLTFPIIVSQHKEVFCMFLEQRARALCPSGFFVLNPPIWAIPVAGCEEDAIIALGIVKIVCLDHILIEHSLVGHAAINIAVAAAEIAHIVPAFV